MRLVSPRALALAAALLLCPPGAAQEKKHFEGTYPFQRSKEVKLGLKYKDVTIESFRIRGWPDADDLEKAEKDLNDKTTMVVEFTYSNRDLDQDFKCHYQIEIPGCKDGPCGENDRKANLDKGKVGDTNKVLVRMRTLEFKTAKKIKIAFDIWED